MRLLIVEDNDDLQEVLRKQLTGRGYAVDACSDAPSAMDYLNSSEYDIVILDIGLPGMNGMELLAWIRQQEFNVQVLMLTALDSIDDKVKGLDSGADDYVTKPFHFEELVARIRTLTRRRSQNKTNIYELADLIVDSSTGKVMRSGKEIALSRREFTVLEYLIANKGIVLSREQIEAHVLDFSYEGSSNLIDVYIRYLRKKIDEDYPCKLIHTVRGRGYVLREDEQC